MAAAPLLSREEELHWIALRMIPGLGSRKAVHLVETYRTPLSVFRASRSELESWGMTGSIAQSIASGCTFDDAVDQQQRMAECGADAVPFTDPRYPERLREIYDPPLLLFARGRVNLLKSLSIGVVGTRRPSTYGIAATERLSTDLARSGLTITSGLARGIDTAAHRATLKAEGQTIAVLGCGVEVVYPSENRKIAQEIAEKGLIVSEFPMGSPPYPQNFPIRNRIISGLSIGVLVVEGAQYSGSSITAKLAMDQQREVFAVPGNITSDMSWGPNLLIKQGAKLVQDANDVINELSADDRRRLTVGPTRELFGDIPEQDQQRVLAENPQTVVARTLLDRLQPDSPTHLDSLLETLEYHSATELIAALFELEMLGLVRQLPGKNFVKIW